MTVEEPWSDRARIAPLAAYKAASVPGVAGLVSGPGDAWRTGTPAGVVHGVVVAAQADGSLRVTIYVRARPVPLGALAHDVRAVVRDAIDEAQLATPVHQIDVVVADLAEVAS